MINESLDRRVGENYSTHRIPESIDVVLIV